MPTIKIDGSTPSTSAKAWRIVQTIERYCNVFDWWKDIICNLLELTGAVLTQPESFAIQGRRVNITPQMNVYDTLERQRIWAYTLRGQRAAYQRSLVIT